MQDIIAEFLHKTWSESMKTVLSTDKSDGYFRGDGDYIIRSGRVRGIRRLMNLKYDELDGERKCIVDCKAKKLLELINIADTVHKDD